MPTSPVADLIQRSAAANAALMRGDVDGYRALVPLTCDFTLMSPFGGAPTHGADMTGERWEAMGRFFRNGTLEQEVVQTYASVDMVVLAVIERLASKSAACRSRTGRCASHWSIVAKGPNGCWRIGMPTLSSPASAWIRRRRLHGRSTAGTSDVREPRSRNHSFCVGPGSGGVAVLTFLGRSAQSRNAAAWSQRPRYPTM